jgi:ABC-type multidrug transport system fused ATPase/permease subunit
LVTIRSALQIVPLVGVLVVLEPRLALGAIASLSAFAFVLRRLRRALKRSHAEAIVTTEELALAADETVRHADLWRVHGAEHKARARVASIGRELARQAGRVAAMGAAVSGANEVLAGLVLVGLVLLTRSGVVEVRADRIVPFVATFFLAYRPLRDATEAQLALGRARAAQARLADVLADGVAPEPEPPAELGEATLDVDVVLPRGSAKRVAFRAEFGRVVAIRGPTGAGKTTLLRVLLGLEAPERGHVRYGGALVDGAPGLARPFAWVPQDAPVLADTLDANIRLGGDADPGVLLETIGAERLTTELGDARLGPQAVSGGERQWIAIARALATDRPVLLLDEPTSGLDASAQRDVLRAIRALRGRRTVIIVTHRPEPLALADEVIDLERPTPSLAVA